MDPDRIPLITRDDWQTEFRLPIIELDAAHAISVLEQLFPRLIARTQREWDEALALAERIVVERGPHGLIARFESGDCLIARTHRAVTLGLFAHTSYPHDPSLKTALILAVGLNNSDFRKRLTEAPWRRITDSILRSASLVESKKAPKRSEGWVRAVLRDEEDDLRGLVDGALELQLIRLGVKTGEPLKPQKAPKDEEGLLARLVDPSAGDRRVIQLAERRRILEQRDRHRWGSDAVHRADADLLASLTGVTEVYFGDRPITVGQGEWLPALALRDTKKGPVMDWRARPEGYWARGSGFVVDHEFVLWAVPPRLQLVLPHLLRNLPLSVPEQDVGDFVQQFVVPAPMPVALETTEVEVRSGAPTPRLLLVDDGGRLTVDVRFEYGGILIPAGAGSVFEALDGLVQRDLNAEARLRADLAAVTGHVPANYHGDAAYDFLFEDLPKLGWAVDADRALLKKVGGTVSAQVRFESGTDWFDLDVELSNDRVKVKLRDAVAAFRAGRRYVELRDGTVAQLPDVWMQRYGETAAELVDIRRHTKKRMGAHIAPLVDDLLAQAEGAKAAIDRWHELATKAQQFDSIPDRALPKGLKAELRDYQVIGYRWMAALADMELGGVLADDMGLGKTVQALAWMLDRRERGGKKTPPVLVVAPTSVIYNWVSEAKRFAPKLKVHLHHGASRGEPPKSLDVLVTSYALLRRDLPVLNEIEWGGMVLDEAQHIKNPDSQVAKAARAIKARHRFALSGTPLENHLVELWSLFEFLLPGFFAGREHFRRRYVKPVQQDGDNEALARLKTRIRPFVMRRLKSEVASELPPRQEQVLHCEMGPAQRRVYETIREDYRDSVTGHLSEDGGLGKAAFHVLEALTRMRQACCDPSLLPTKWASSAKSAKRVLALELLDELIGEGHRALVFSQWPRSLKAIAAELTARGHDYLYLDGSTRERGGLQERWNDPAGPPVFLISIKAGGSGLNLTGADHVIHLDPWWNPAVENQATDRAHRIGQDKPVVVYKLVTKDSVEEKILEMQARKKDLFDRTVDQDRAWLNSLSADDVTSMFDSDSGPGPVQLERLEVAEDPLDVLLATHPLLTNKIVRDHIGGNAAEARRMLSRWVEEGHLIQSGQAKGTKYRARVKARRLPEG